MPFAPAGSWTASPDRTLPLRTIDGARAPLTWPTKDPGETLDVSLYLHPDIADATDLPASAPSVAVSPSGLTVSAPSVSGRVLTVWLSGGTLGTTYALTWTVTLATGRVLVASGAILVGAAVPGATVPGVVFTASTLEQVVGLLPTDPTGLAVGKLWNDGGTIKQVQP